MLTSKECETSPFEAATPPSTIYDGGSDSGVSVEAATPPSTVIDGDSDTGATGEVIFTCRMEPDNRGRLFVAGSIDKLGNWSSEKAVAMSVSNYDDRGRLEWTCKTQLPVGVEIEYKFMEKISRPPNLFDQMYGWNHCDGFGFRFEGGSNRKYTVKGGHNTIEVDK